MARVAVILAGCGHLDGAEIREAVLALLYLDARGASVQCFAPDRPQHHVMNHRTRSEAPGERNILDEAARIARGEVLPLAGLKPEEYDALVLPGGYGVAKNCADLAFRGAQAEVAPDYAAAIRGFYAAKKPILAICIAPAVVALALKGEGIALTIGEDAGTAALIESTGNRHATCSTEEACVDEAHRVISCPAYMRDDRIAQVARGIEQGVAALLAMLAGAQERKAS